MSRSDVSIGLCEVVCHFEELEDQTMPPRQNFMEYGHSCPSAALRHCRSECCCALTAVRQGDSARPMSRT